MITIPLPMFYSFDLTCQFKVGYPILLIQKLLMWFILIVSSMKWINSTTSEHVANSTPGQIDLGQLAMSNHWFR